MTAKRMRRLSARPCSCVTRLAPRCLVHLCVAARIGSNRTQEDLRCMYRCALRCREIREIESR